MKDKTRRCLEKDLGRIARMLTALSYFQSDDYAHYERKNMLRSVKKVAKLAGVSLEGELPPQKKK